MHRIHSTSDCLGSRRPYVGEDGLVRHIFQGFVSCARLLCVLPCLQADEFSRKKRPEPCSVFITVLVFLCRRVWCNQDTSFLNLVIGSMSFVTHSSTRKALFGDASVLAIFLGQSRLDCFQLLLSSQVLGIKMQPSTACCCRFSPFFTSSNQDTVCLFRRILLLAT